MERLQQDMPKFRLRKFPADPVQAMPTVIDPSFT
jgi:hypothetical protein